MLYNAGAEADLDNLHKIGSITALIPEAADASVTGATVKDGMSGDKREKEQTSNKRSTAADAERARGASKD